MIQEPRSRGRKRITAATRRAGRRAPVMIGRVPVSPVENDSGNSDQPSDPDNVDCCGRRLVWWEFRESGNRLGLPISSFSLNDQQKLESPGDPNTNYSFGIAQIGGRSPQLTVDPLATLIATRDTLAQISGVTDSIASRAKAKRQAGLPSAQPGRTKTAKASASLAMPSRFKAGS